MQLFILIPESSKYLSFVPESSNMAYISRAWASGWEPSGSDFNTKLGKLLANGADIKASSAAAALASTVAAAEAGGPHTQAAQLNANPYERSGSSKPCIGPHPGYAWVDAHGHPLAIGPPATAALMTAAVNSPASTIQQQHSALQSSTSTANPTTSNFGTMTATQRSMTIWKRISPGMLPGTSATPQSTTAEAHAYDPSVGEAIDFTHHLKKTDFGDYTECALRHMHHIKAAAKK